MFSALEIARYVLWYCTFKGMPISNLKLQKILYFIWIDFYSCYYRYLFKDEIQAWQFGPVVPIVYFNYCQYACLKIHINEKPANVDKLNLLDTLIDKYYKLSIFELNEKTYLPKTPWYAVYYNGKSRKQAISFRLLKNAKTINDF